MPPDAQNFSTTRDYEYAYRLERITETKWKKLLDVQRPYRWNLRRLHLGRVLDIGCGVGRNLRNLDCGSVGVDHNAQCVAFARARGLRAYTPEQFAASPDAKAQCFDSILIAHVLEHLDFADANQLIRTYLPFLNPTGRIVIITPQEAGFRTDSTHIRFVDGPEMLRHTAEFRLETIQSFSFPFPRFLGLLFPHNEFVFVCRPRPIADRQLRLGVNPPLR